MTAILALRDVCKRYRDGLREITVLDRVSLELYEGETVGVLASRGAGKTTLLRVAAGLQTPDAGEVCWRGRDLAGLSADGRARARRHGGIALARGDWRAEDCKAVVEHVGLPLYSEGLSMEQAEAGAWRALDIVGAAGLGHMWTDRLGTAERVRVELARAIVREPSLLLIDEPAVLPRPKEAADLYALIRSLPGRLGLALLIASEEIAALRGAGRIANLDNGHMYSTDSRHKVISFPDRRGAA